MAKILLTTATLDGPEVVKLASHGKELGGYVTTGKRRVVTLHLRIDAQGLLDLLGRSAANAKKRRAVEAGGLVEVIATEERIIPDTQPAGTPYTSESDARPMLSKLTPPVVDASLRT